MKFFIAIALAAVVLVAAVVADETTAERMKVVADALRLRDAPSTATGVKIGLLSAGEVVEVLEVSGDWARVRTVDGLTGWACIRLEGETFLSSVDSSSGSTAEATHADADAAKSVYDAAYDTAYDSDAAKAVATAAYEAAYDTDAAYAFDTYAAYAAAEARKAFAAEAARKAVGQAGD